MDIRKLLLATGLALASASPALALVDEDSELDYVRVCDIYGAGYFYIPGTETCLKIGGYVRFEAEAGTGSGGSSTERWDFITEYGIKFDVRTQTDYGTLRAFSSFYGDTTDHAPGTDLPFLKADKAFIQFAGFTFGYRDSLFDHGGGYTYDPGLTSDVYNSAIRYTWDLGDGLMISLAAEDPYPRWGASYTPESGLPDIVARISDKYAWGKLAGSIGVADLTTGTAWGLKGQIDLHLDTFGLGDHDRLRFVVGYARDGGDWLGGNGVSAGDWFSGLASLKINLNPTYKWNLVSTLSFINGPGYSDDEWKAAIGTYWRPAPGLKLGVEANFSAETGSHSFGFSSPDHSETQVLFSAIRTWGGMSRMDN